MAYSSSESDSESGDEPSSSQLEKLLEQLRNTPPAFRDEELAPDVDDRILRRLARGKLEEDAARSAFYLLHSFQSWRDAFSRILLEEFQRGDTDVEEPD